MTHGAGHEVLMVAATVLVVATGVSAIVIDRLARDGRLGADARRLGFDELAVAPLITMSLGAAAIHFGVIGAHFEEWWRSGSNPAAARSDRRGVRRAARNGVRRRCRHDHVDRSGERRHIRPRPLTRPLERLPRPRALVFDLDGTLVDTVDARIEAWMRAFAEAGISADRERVAELIGSDGKRLAREIAKVAGHSLPAEEAELLDRRSGELYDAINTDPKPFPGARELLGALNTGKLRWAIATSSRKEQVTASVQALRLPHQPTIVDGSHVTHAKPAPDLMLETAKRLGLEPPECWCVGDATWDMRSASAAGMVPVGVSSGAVDGQALTDAGAAVAVDSLVEIADELRRRQLIS